MPCRATRDLAHTVEDGLTIHKYWTSACSRCAIKPQCTTNQYRRITRWEHEGALEAMQKRLNRTPQASRIRRQTAEHPFGTIKAWMGATHFLTKTIPRVSTEMSLHLLAYQSDADTRTRTAHGGNGGSNAFFSIASTAPRGTPNSISVGVFHKSPREHSAALPTDWLPVKLGFDLLPQRESVRDHLFAHRRVRVGDLVHHPLAREDARQRRAPVAPPPPRLIGPILIVCTFGRRRVEPECAQQQRMGFEGSCTVRAVCSSRSPKRASAVGSPASAPFWYHAQACATSV